MAGIFSTEADAIKKGEKWARGDSNPTLTAVQPLTDVNRKTETDARDVLLLEVKPFKN